MVFPTLELEDVTLALREHHFALKTTQGAHQVWECLDDGGDRVIVTIDTNDSPYTYRSQSLRAIIRQSGIAPRVFYWKAGKPLPWGPDSSSA